MSEPNFAVNFTANMLATEACAIGNALLFDSVLGRWRVATAATRAAVGKRAEAVAMTAYGGSVVGKVAYQASGTVSAEISGLGVGAESWVRVSTLGGLERCTPGVGDDLVGKCATDGRLHLDMGVWDSTNYAGGGGGGGGFTAGGDLSGTSTSQTVEKVKGTTISTAGGALPVGAVLRTTAAGTADWGTVDLADTDAVTGTLPVVRGGTNITTAGLSGQANKAVTVNVGETGYTFTSIPAGASTPTGTGFTTNTSGVQDSASAPYPLIVAKGGTHQNALGSALQVLRTNAGATDTEWATISGTAPGGSTGQFQWNNSAAFAGSSGLIYDSVNNRPQAVNGYAIRASTFDAVLSCTPTAARTITFPDASDTVCELTQTQTLTNKTLVAASNTITDTSAATGDILRHNGTRFVRLARGTANQLLQTNAGATDIAWATVASAAPGGSSGTVQYNNASAFGGITNVSTDGVNSLSFASTSGFVQWLTGGSPSGFIRLKTGQSNKVIDIDDGGGSARGGVLICDPTSSLNTFGFSAFNTNLNGSSTSIQSAGAAYITCASSLIASAMPRVGSSTPYSSEGRATIAVTTATRTLSAAEYSRTIWKFTTTVTTIAVTVPLPASEDASYIKQIQVQPPSGGSSTQWTFTAGAGTNAVTVTAGVGAYVKGTLVVTPGGCEFYGFSSAGAVIVNP